MSAAPTSMRPRSVFKENLWYKKETWSFVSFTVVKLLS